MRIDRVRRQEPVPNHSLQGNENVDTSRVTMTLYLMRSGKWASTNIEGYLYSASIVQGFKVSLLMLRHMYVCSFFGLLHVLSDPLCAPLRSGYSITSQVKMSPK